MHLFEDAIPGKRPELGKLFVVVAVGAAMNTTPHGLQPYYLLHVRVKASGQVGGRLVFE